MVLQNLDVCNEGGFLLRVGEGGISEAVCGAAGGGERLCFYSRRTLVRILSRVFVLEGQVVSVEFCEVLYGADPHLGG